ncbi:DUF1365 domain-containing protein [uncultured Maricaulis sp.]|uniref:DUF1365 domain-containing protein n=1 Tax=uncultured Maricaulis sp. TaxID=174710 RepID=UPI0025D0166B|nr:DUF1365 domain-containing protein [uncultured Maricaulis sp.]
MTPRPASLLIGQVGHTRRGPRHHSLRYRMASVLVDIDGPDVPRSRRLGFGFNRAALVSLFTRDHGGADMALRDWVETRLREAGVSGPFGRIQLLAAPRVLGLAFNPVSVFFAHAPDGRLIGLIFEVSNFHSGRCAYAFPVETETVETETDADGSVRLTTEKRFFVSPFNPVAGTYQFRINRDAGVYRLGIQLIRDDAVVLSAAHTARLEPLEPARLRAAAWLVATNTGRIFFGILWEALKLRLKGLAMFAPRRGTIDTMPGRH